MLRCMLLGTGNSHTFIKSNTVIVVVMTVITITVVCVVGVATPVTLFFGAKARTAAIVCNDPHAIAYIVPSIPVINFGDKVGFFANKLLP